MALLKYFRKKEEACGQKLPDPCGPLRQEVDEKLTEEANREVALVLESQAESSTRGSTKHDSYLKVTSEQKAIVAKYAAEHGVARAIRRFSMEFGSTLKESTIRGWKKAYVRHFYLHATSAQTQLQRANTVSEAKPVKVFLHSQKIQ